MNTANEKVAAFLKSNPNANKAAISEATGIKGIVLHNLLKKMENDGLIISEGSGADASFKLNSQEEEQTEETVSAPFYRDISKFTFNKESYGKGPLVRAVVAKYVEDNPTVTYKKLKEVFPDELLKRYGIFQDEATAREISGKRDRYFFKPEHVIKLKDKKIVVCNQLTFQNIQPFLKVAKQLGYKIK